MLLFTTVLSCGQAGMVSRKTARRGLAASVPPDAAEALLCLQDLRPAAWTGPLPLNSVCTGGTRVAPALCGRPAQRPSSHSPPGCALCCSPGAGLQTAHRGSSRAQHEAEHRPSGRRDTAAHCPRPHGQGGPTHAASMDKLSQPLMLAVSSMQLQRARASGCLRCAPGKQHRDGAP